MRAITRREQKSRHQEDRVLRRTCQTGERCNDIRDRFSSSEKQNYQPIQDNMSPALANNGFLTQKPNSPKGAVFMSRGVIKKIHREIEVEPLSSTEITTSE